MERDVSKFAEQFERAIRECAATNTREVFSTFATYEDVGNGIFAAGLDTLDNSLLHAKRHEVTVRRLRQQMIERDGWLNCCSALLNDSGHPSIHDFNTSFSRFKHRGVVRERVDEWVENPGITPQHVLWLSWMIMDVLVQRKVFDEIVTSQPFRLCHMSFDKDDALVLRVLNWPAHQGPRV